MMHALGKNATKHQPKGSPMSKDTPQAQITEEIKNIPLDAILVDYDWNSRSLANVMSEHSETAEDKEGTGIKGLKDDLSNDGQDSPVMIRPTKETAFYKKTDKPYALVSGFRRYTAIKALNDDADLVKRRREEHNVDPSVKHHGTVVPNCPNGHIRAVVRTMTEADARKLNLRENTLRDNLSTPDIMRGVVELSKLGLTQVEIGLQLGKAQAYCGKLLRISTVDPKVLEHWRLGGEFQGIKSAAKVTTNDLDDISRLDRKEQVEAYTRILKGKLASVDGSDTPEKQWLEAAKKKAIQVATLIGSMQRDIYRDDEKLGPFLKLTNKVTWIDVVEAGLVVNFKKKELKRREIRSIADAAEKAYVAELNREEKEEEDEGEEEVA
jgi:ParB-like chromosome segregation protein Spo0J